MLNRRKSGPLKYDVQKVHDHSWMYVETAALERLLLSHPGQVKTARALTNDRLLYILSASYTCSFNDDVNLRVSNDSEVRIGKRTSET